MCILWNLNVFTFFDNYVAPFKTYLESKFQFFNSAHHILVFFLLLHLTSVQKQV